MKYEELDKQLNHTVAAYDALKKHFGSLVERLTPRELRVINLRYGITYTKKLTLEQIGNLFGVTRERVRQIEKKILRKLRIFEHNIMDEIDFSITCPKKNIDDILSHLNDDMEKKIIMKKEKYKDAVHSAKIDIAKKITGRYSYNGEVYDNLTDYIKALQNSEDRCNSYKPWSMDDDARLVELSKSMSTKELCECFKRSRGAISSRLRKLDISNPKSSSKHVTSKDVSDHQFLEEHALIFLTAIINDADPLTGEKINDSSIWRHPQVKKDIEDYLNKYKSDEE